MPRYVIHIGPSKTGSKYLQSTLYHHREALLRQGIDYTSRWCSEPGEFTHTSLFQALAQKRYAEVAAGFRELNSSDARVVILSCESFAELSPEALSVLRDALEGNRAEIIYYCRRWSERLPSDWKQAVQSGFFMTLPEFYHAATRHALYSASINYSLVWATICSVFGRRSLKLVSYNNLRDKGEDLFRHFTQNFLAWGAETPSQDIPSPDIVSPGAPDIEIIRALNWIDHQATGRHRWNMRIKFMKYRDTLDTQEIRELMADQQESLEISDGAEVFRLSWQEMQKYTDRLVPWTLTGRRLFERHILTVRHVRSDYLLKQGASARLYQLYHALDALPCDDRGIS